MASRHSCGEGSGCTHPETSAVVLELQARSSRTLAAKAPPPSAYEHDDDDHDDAAEALLALQGMSAGSPAPPARSPGGHAHTYRGANGSFKRLASGTSSPTAMESRPCDTLGEAQAKPFHRASAIDLGDACGSSGSAEDKYSEQQVGPEPDLLLDMQVSVEPGNDKGCQVWFPPQSDDELRKRGLYHHLAHGAPAGDAAGDIAGGDAAPAGGYSRGDAAMPSDDASDRKRKLSDGGMFSAFAATKPQYGSRLTLRDSMHSPGHTTNSPKDAPSGGGGGGDAAGPQKRPRFIWTDELHRRFVHVVNQLGVKTAVPKAILQMLNVEGMTRENVASHLQKYRMAIKRSGGGGAPGDVAATESGSHTVSETAGDAAAAAAATLTTSQSAPAPLPKRRQLSPAASLPAAPQQPVAETAEAVHVNTEEWDARAAAPPRARTVQTAQAMTGVPQVLQLQQQQQPEAPKGAHRQEAMPGSMQVPRSVVDGGNPSVASVSLAGLRSGGAGMAGGACAGPHAVQPAAAAAESDVGRSMPRGLVSQLLLQQQQSLQQRQQAAPLMQEASPTPGGRVVGGSPVLGSGQVMGNAQVLQMLHSNAVHTQPAHLPVNGGSPNVVMTLPLSVLQGLIGTSGNNIMLLPTNGAVAPSAANS